MNSKKRLWGLIRGLVPCLILGWIVFDIQRDDPEAMRRIIQRPKDWRWGAVALTCMLTATCLAFSRWYLLVTGIGIPLSLRDAFRLGFLGYVLNFVGPGAVGGDFYKAYFLAKSQSSRRLEAIATIFLDRVIGLFCLMCVGTVMVLFTETGHLARLRGFVTALPILTCIAGTGLILPLILPIPWLRVLDRCDQIPGIGPFLGSTWKRVEGALLLYRQRPRVLLAVFGLGLGVHLLMGIAIHWADRAMFVSTPTFAQHVVISTLASAAGGLPVPGGIGTYEFAMSYVFPRLADPNLPLEEGQGFAVALSYRLMTVLIAAIGLVFYLCHRRDIQATIESLPPNDRAG